MFSTTQLDMLEPMVQAMYKEGFIYYVVHTNTNINSYSNYDFVDMDMYFSKQPFTYSNYKFTNNEEVLHFEVISRNVSNNNTDSKLDRISYTVNNSISFTVPKYEHILTNTSGSYFGNVLALQEYKTENNLAYNVDLNYFSVIPVLISILIILKWLSMWFAKEFKS